MKGLFGRLSGLVGQKIRLGIHVPEFSPGQDLLIFERDESGKKVLDAKLIDANKKVLLFNKKEIKVPPELLTWAQEYTTTLESARKQGQKLFNTTTKKIRPKQKG